MHKKFKLNVSVHEDFKECYFFILGDGWHTIKYSCSYGFLWAMRTYGLLCPRAVMPKSGRYRGTGKVKKTIRKTVIPATGLCQGKLMASISSLLCKRTVSKTFPFCHTVPIILAVSGLWGGWLQKARNMLWSWGHATWPDKMGRGQWGRSLPVCFSETQLWCQLAEKAGITVWLNIYVSGLYQNHCAWLPYVSWLQEFTVFSIGVWYWMKILYFLLPCVLTFL